MTMMPAASALISSDGDFGALTNDIIDYRSSNGPHQVPGGDWVVSAVDPEDAAFGVVGQQGAST
jgi:hypothetical protein